MLSNHTEKSQDFTFPYDLNKPDKRLKLDKSLREISGIAYYDKGQLAAVQDEAGKVYILSLEDGRIQKTVKFAKDGDFEGITHTGKELIALRSDGKIYQFLAQKDALHKTEWKTGLKAKQDCEGIAWHTPSHTLWIVAKGKPYDKLEDKHDKAVYEFDQKNESLKLKLSISQNTLEAQFDAKERFEPSGIAFAPDAQHVYLLSSAGKALLVMNLQGEPVFYQPLKRDLFPQPEGICFDDKARLIIASEGRDKKARLLIFEAQK